MKERDVNIKMNGKPRQVRQVVGWMYSGKLYVKRTVPDTIKSRSAVENEAMVKKQEDMYT